MKSTRKDPLLADGVSGICRDHILCIIFPKLKAKILFMANILLATLTSFAEKDKTHLLL